MIGAAVVDEYDFVGRSQRIERRVEPLEQCRQPRLLVVDGYDDRNLRAGGLAAARAHDKTLRAASHTRSTSSSAMAGNKGRVAIRRAIFSATGKSPSRCPSARYSANRWMAG